MAKKRSTKPSIKAEATAKAELTAKATYQRKHTTTEIVPPDVTRAKAGAWLDLISPITEWAGLKGDELRNKRALLRIQQEETLLRIAKSVRKRLGDKRVVKAVPTKVLIPSIESASLEDPTDDVMIEIWSNLLSSAASGAEVEPKYVAILKELSGRQANMLRDLATYKADKFEFPYEQFIDSEYDLEFSNFIDTFHERFPPSKVASLSDLNEFLEQHINAPGSVIDLAYVDYSNGIREALEISGTAHEGIFEDRQSLSICLTLGLIARENDSIVGEFRTRQRSGPGALKLSYYHLTLLGATLIELCDPGALVTLKKPNGRIS
jgi:hypothetical protein